MVPIDLSFELQLRAERESAEWPFAAAAVSERDEPGTAICA